MTAIRRVIQLSISIISLMALSWNASAERFATIIVNGNYQNADWALETPVPSGQLLATTLESIGFEVVLISDASQSTMRRASRDHMTRVNDAGSDSLGLFFFSGHAASVQGESYLLSTDFRGQGAMEAVEYGISVSDIVGSQTNTTDGNSIFVLDACFEFPPEKARSSIGPLGSVSSFPVNALLALSQVPGKTCSYDAPLSPFVQEFAIAMDRPNSTADEVFRDVRGSILEMTLQQQMPWWQSSLRPEVRFQYREPGPAFRPLLSSSCEGNLKSQEAAPDRMALLIGNNAYTTDAWSYLSEPINDIAVLADSLKATGFQVRACQNLDLMSLEEEISNLHDQFEQAASAAAASNKDQPAAFVYFSGHGASDPVNRINYLIPTDSGADRADALRGEAFSIDRLARGFNSSSGQVVLVIDACRNALKVGTTKGDDKGLVPFQQRPNLFIASATQAGEVASESVGYAKFLAERIVADGETWESEVAFVFRDVGEAVYEASNGKQQPITEGELRGRFFFQSPNIAP